MSEGSESSRRTIGLVGATGIGVGAIVGGGILVLAGEAFATTGPATIVAFAVNGFVAFLTAMSFAEVSSAFPESGGAYNFAKKVLSVRAAFAVGWVLWFAYIVAGVLYALGFAKFMAIALRELLVAIEATPPIWLEGRNFMLLLASVATLAYAIGLVRKTAGGGQFATMGKLVLFAVLIVAGLVALFRGDTSESVSNLSPFFSGGASGLVVTMGFTFIALQGFDLISAVGGEVKNPGKNIPRAMFLSLGLALVVYLPLLFLVSSAGVAPGESVAEVAAADPENIIPVAAQRFMGRIGYWLVVIAAILSTLSALQANLFAASRVALSMAEDRTLPSVLGDLHATRRTPIMAIYATTLTLIAIGFMIPDLAAAGSAASLIFLISFALAHGTTLLARYRGGTTTAAYQTPMFPLVPVVGGLACAGLAVFQAIAVPDAGGIVLMWLALGVILYWSLFARRAEMADAALSAADPSLVSLRGHSPLVLLPIANPAHAPGMVAVANALAARKVGRVLLLSIVPMQEETDSEELASRLTDVQKAIGDALTQSYRVGHQPEALITAASRPLEEIARVAAEHRCAALLVGLGDTTNDAASPALEELINRVDCDVALMRAAAGWRLESVRRILVPIGGRGEVHELRARLLGSICRDNVREVVFVTGVDENASEEEVEETRRQISWLGDLRSLGTARTEVVRSSDVAAALIEMAADFDLMVLGLQSTRWRRKVFGTFALRMAEEAPCATILLSRRPPKAFEFLDPLRDDVVDSLRDAVSDKLTWRR